MSYFNTFYCSFGGSEKKRLLFNIPLKLLMWLFLPLLTSSEIPRFWLNPCQTGFIRSRRRLYLFPTTTPPHHSQRSPPRPFWALCISCAKLLICLVTSQCFLHEREGKISTLLCAVNHSVPPLIHWYGHYSIRLHSNWPQILVFGIVASPFGNIKSADKNVSFIRWRPADREDGAHQPACLSAAV